MAKATAYRLGSIPEDQKFRGQPELIIAALRAATEPQTVEQITAAIADKLQTRQDPQRVTSYYMTVWKKKGWVRPSEVEVPDGPEAASTDAEVNAEDAASTGATEEQRGEAHVESEVMVLEASAKVSDAVMHALRKGGDDALSPDEIVQYLNGHGYKCSQQQVAGALQNLLRRGAVARDGEGFSVAQVNA